MVNVLDPSAIAALDSSEAAINYIRGWYKKVEDEIRKKPKGDVTQLNAVDYVTWERKTLIMYGQAAGALQGLQAFSIIPLPLFKELKRTLVALLLRVMADEQLGVRARATGGL